MRNWANIQRDPYTRPECSRSFARENVWKGRSGSYQESDGGPYCFGQGDKEGALLYVVDSMLKTEPDIFFLSFKFA